MATPYEIALQSGSTKLCRCFRLIRRDGIELGFTDHDQDVTFDGTTFRAQTALTASEASSSLGLAPDEMDAQGALSDDAITERDLVAGLYDGAGVEVFDVDWSNPSVRDLMGRYSVGEVERTGVAFRSEMRSLTASLDRKKGRVYSTLCDVKRLGDIRCKLSLASFTGTATVISANGLEVLVSGLDGFENGFFDRGTVTWTGGANDGAEGDLRASVRGGSQTVLSLWRKSPFNVSPGDTLTVVAGCDRTAATCKARFSNLDNFRGFPHMPGDSFSGEYAVTGNADQVGGSRFET